MDRKDSFIIYTKDNCQWCDKAKIALSDFIVAEFNVSDEQNKTLLKEKGLKTVPQVWFSPYKGELKYIGGYDRLVKWLEESQKDEEDA